MSDGKWSGGAMNRSWNRPGRRRVMTADDVELGRRLFAQMKGTPFFCETCGRMHPLAGHQTCRELEAARPNII